MEQANAIWEEKQHKALTLFEELYGSLSPREISLFYTVFELGVMAGTNNPEPIFDEEHQDDVRCILYRDSTLTREQIKQLSPEQLWWLDALSKMHKPFTGVDIRDVGRTSRAYKGILAVWEEWARKRLKKEPGV